MRKTRYSCLKTIPYSLYYAKASPNSSFSTQQCTTCVPLRRKIIESAAAASERERQRALFENCKFPPEFDSRDNSRGSRIYLYICMDCSETRMPTITFKIREKRYPPAANEVISKLEKGHRLALSLIKIHLPNDGKAVSKVALVYSFQ